jgi:hypothetical protein
VKKIAAAIDKMTTGIKLRQRDLRLASLTCAAAGGTGVGVCSGAGALSEVDDSAAISHLLSLRPLLISSNRFLEIGFGCPE